MIINPTNINKTNNHPSSLLNSEHKKTTIYEVGNASPGFRQAQQYGGVKPFNGITTLPVYKTFWELFVNVMNYFQKEYIKHCKNTGNFNSNFHTITTPRRPLTWHGGISLTDCLCTD